MKPTLKGRIALVTGGGRGIGRTLALGLARAGADVAVLSRTTSEVLAVEAEIRGLGRRALAITADVAVERETERAVAACVERLGAPDILVNAAAIQGPIGRFDEVPWEAWRQTIQVDLLGAIAMTRAVLPHMVRGRRGKIINLSGGGAAGPRPRFTAYATAKAALVRFTETLAEELRDTGIQVNAIAPGATRTRMTEEVLEAGERAGARARAEAESVRNGGSMDPERQMALAAFLAGDDSRHVSGRLIHVNDPWPELRGRGVPDDEVYTLRRVCPLKIGV